jgi:hypothetical protein
MIYAFGHGRNHFTSCALIVDPKVHAQLSAATAG